MGSPFFYSQDNKRYHTWSYYLKRTFGCKVAKVSLDAGFTCPNKDGTRGVGGCSYCSGGSGGQPDLSLAGQFTRGCGIQRRKWPDAKLIAYFQAGTNTHAPVKALRAAFEPFVGMEEVVGLCVATRADALWPEVMEYLEELSRRTWLLVELGLQTIHDETAQRINRCHSYKEFLEGYHNLKAVGIRTCVHLINGLPGESQTMMLQTVKEVAALHPHSIKLHMLHLLQGTALAEQYEKESFPLLSREEYVSLVCDQLELLPPEIVLQRLTGDPERKDLIGPMWTLDKRRVLNSIDKELASRNSWQGRAL